MDFKEIKKYLEENKDKEEVKSFVQGLNPINLEKVKAFVAEEKDAISWFDSERDKHLSKGIETFKSNNLEKLVNEKVKELYPEDDPKDTEIKKMKLEIEKMKNEKLRESLVNKAIKIADTKKLPIDLVEFFVSNDEEKTLENLTKLESVFGNHVQTLVEEKLKDGSYTPPKGGDDKKTTLTTEDLKNMSIEEINANWDKVK